MEGQTLFHDRILAGQPQPLDLEEARRDGTKTVVNLRPPEEMTEFDEAALGRLREASARVHEISNAVSCLLRGC